METEQILFRQKSNRGRKSEIIECSDHYRLIWERANGSQALVCFDKQDKVLNAVIKALSDFGNPQYSTYGPIFQKFEGRKTIYICSLAQVITAALRGGKRNDYSRRRIKYLDQNPFNLQGNNIFYPEKVFASVVEISGEKFIRLKYKEKTRGTLYSITNYDPALYKIVLSLHWDYYERGQIFKAVNTYRKEQYPFHYLVWVFFRCGATETNWKEKIAELRASNATMDHKHSAECGLNKWDNRIENLQLMPRKLNSKKGNCTSKLRANCFFIPTEEGAIYGKYENEYIEMCSIEDITESNLGNLKTFCSTGNIASELDGLQLKLSSKEAINVLKTDLFEAKLYQEVCKT